MELISLKADFAAKELFAHEKVRKQFLSDKLGIPLKDIKSVRLLNPFLRRRYKRQKQGRVPCRILSQGQRRERPHRPVGATYH